MIDIETAAKQIQASLLDPETELRIKVWLLPDSALITTAEVCALAQISVKTWIDWRKSYSNPPMRFGPAGAYEYRKSSVINFLKRIGKLSKSKDSVEHKIEEALLQDNG